MTFNFFALKKSNKKSVAIPVAFTPEDGMEAKPPAYEFCDLSEGTASKGGRRAQGTVRDKNR